MKKLMFVAAAIAAGVAVADVTSANVVGYMEVERPSAYQNYCGGSFLMTVGATEYSLADLEITGPSTIANARNNYIMGFTKDVAANVDKNRCYWLWQGIWRVRDKTNPNTDTKLSAEQAAAIKFNAGEGFMCNFMHATTKVRYAGEVLTGGESKEITITRPADYQNFVVCNCSGAEISLFDIKLAGPATIANARNNYLMGFTTDVAANVDKNRCYWFWQNVWRIRDKTNPNTDTKLTDEQAKAIKFKAGEGFMCNFMHSTTTVTMPTSL